MPFMMDGHFGLQRFNKLDDPNDVSLHQGNAFFPKDDIYDKFVSEVVATSDEKSTCSKFNAVEMQNKLKFKGCVITDYGRDIIEQWMSMSTEPQLVNGEWVSVYRIRHNNVLSQDDIYQSCHGHEVNATKMTNLHSERLIENLTNTKAMQSVTVIHNGINIQKQQLELKQLIKHEGLSGDDLKKRRQHLSREVQQWQKTYIEVAPKKEFKDSERVQWFRTRADMMRCVEEVEILEEDIRRFVRASEKMAEFWNGVKATNTPNNASEYIVYARQKGAMYSRMAQDARTAFAKVGVLWPAANETLEDHVWRRRPSLAIPWERAGEFLDEPQAGNKRSVRRKRDDYVDYDSG